LAQSNPASRSYACFATYQLLLNRLSEGRAMAVHGIHWVSSSTMHRVAHGKTNCSIQSHHTTLLPCAGAYEQTREDPESRKSAMLPPPQGAQSQGHAGEYSEKLMCIPVENDTRATLTRN
jgi:hypothetical protein